MDLILSTVCVWQTYTIGTPPPVNAQKVGYLRWGEDLFDVNVARYVDPRTGEPLVVWLQTNNGVGHRVDRNQAHLITNQPGQILSCPNVGQAPLRWMKFTRDTELERCLALGVSKHKERVYLSRFESPTSMKCAGSDVYGVVPAAYAPSEGYSTTEFCGVNASRDVELLCLEQ